MNTLRQLFVEKIKKSQLGFKEVAGAADLQSLMKNRISTPGCYLFRSKVGPSDNLSISSSIQEIYQEISIIVITKNVSISSVTDSSDENERFCALLMDKLLNWKPFDDHDPVVYGGGSLITFLNGLFVWQEVYKTSHFICSKD